MRKQFDLQYYLDHPEVKVVTRCGYDVRVICTDQKDENYPIIALFTYKGVEYCRAYTIEGTTNFHSEKDIDLFFDLPDPEKKRVPLNYDDLLERVKSGKTMWLINDRDTVCNIVDFDFVDSFYINGDVEEIIRVSYEELMDGITFVDGSPCWKEVDE